MPTPRRRRRSAPTLLALLLAAGPLAACDRSGDGEKRTFAPGAVVANLDGAGGSPGDSLVTRADRGRIQGDSAAALWVVKISDFQCPACKYWHDNTYRQFKEAYVDTRRVKFAYVNLPLRMHKHAVPAAHAAMCASAQGKFWQMYDALFATQQQWSPMPSPQPVFDSLATAADVGDMAAWRECVRTEAMRPLIQGDADRSGQAGVAATPSFIIGTSVVEGAISFDRLKVRLDSLLTVSGGATKTR
jgi:protein-disulfide isomerase